MTVCRSPRAGQDVPRATVLPQPLENAEVASLCGFPAGVFVPGASERARDLEEVEPAQPRDGLAHAAAAAVLPPQAAVEAPQQLVYRRVGSDGPRNSGAVAPDLPPGSRDGGEEEKLVVAYEVGHVGDDVRVRLQRVKREPEEVHSCCCCLGSLSLSRFSMIFDVCFF